jgi:hypothetical protein
MDEVASIEKLMESVIPVTESGCWLWVGEIQDDCRESSLDDGHACIDRLSWEAHYGRIPTGQGVCHKCNVGCCINPNHLFLKATEDVV